MYIYIYIDRWIDRYRYRYIYAHDAALKMSKRGDGLHLDRVAVLEGLVEHSRRVDDLSAEQNWVNPVVCISISL